MNDEIAGLRRWARGLLPAEAAVEMIVRPWGGRFAHPGNPWIRAGSYGDCWVEWRQICDDNLAGLSGGERRYLKLAASLGGGAPVDLSEVGGLDHDRMSVLMAALAHAGGLGHRHGWPGEPT